MESEKRRGTGIPDESTTRLQSQGPTDQLSDAQFGEQAQSARHTLWLIAMGMTNDRHLSEDIVQETLTIAWKKLKQFDPNTSFSAWTAAIVRNVALNARRKKFKQNLVSAEQLEVTPSKPTGDNQSPIGGVGQILPNQEAFDDRVMSALGELSGPARSCLLLRTVSGHTYEKISDLLEIAPGTAMSHVFRARKFLRQRLGGGDGRGAKSSAEGGSA